MTLSGESQGVCRRSKRATSACPFAHARPERGKTVRPCLGSIGPMLQKNRCDVSMAVEAKHEKRRRAPRRQSDSCAMVNQQLHHCSVATSTSFQPGSESIGRAGGRVSSMGKQQPRHVRMPHACSLPCVVTNHFAAFARILDCRIELKRLAVSRKEVEGSVRKMMLSQTRFPEASRRHR